MPPDAWLNEAKAHIARRHTLVAILDDHDVVLAMQSLIVAVLGVKGNVLRQASPDEGLLAVGFADRRLKEQMPKQ